MSTERVAMPDQHQESLKLIIKFLRKKGHQQGEPRWEELLYTANFLERELVKNDTL